jgi:hypothetical protein
MPCNSRELPATRAPVSPSRRSRSMVEIDAAVDVFNALTHDQAKEWGW